MGEISGPLYATSPIFFARKRQMIPYTKEDPELWNNIYRYPNYAFSTYGRVLNTRSNSFLYGYAYNEDYPLKVKLRDVNGVVRTCMMHRLIAEAFYTGYESDAQIYFVNDNKHDLHILNLRFIRRGVGQFIPGTRTVRVRRVVTSEGDEFDTVIEAAKGIGVHPSEVYDVIYERRSRIGDLVIAFEWRDILPDEYQPIFRPDRGLFETAEW